MKNNLSNNSESLLEKRINWSSIEDEMKNKFGKDIFESWLKKINFIDEFKSYILISVPTRFIRDWITSRYLDQILQIVKNYNREIVRIEFTINNKNEDYSNKNIVNNHEKTNNFLKDNVSFIKDSYIQYNRLDQNKNFTNFVLGSSNRLAFEASKKVSEDIAH